MSASQISDALPQPHLLTYNSLARALARKGLFSKVDKLLEEMTSLGFPGSPPFTVHH
jgi:pentatricopeptide repeat protein